ncbi:MAG: C2H2-type zinc finger protein [Haloarculaceae archaeon]
MSEPDAAPGEAAGRPDPESTASAATPTHVGTGPGTLDGGFDPPADADVFECGYCGRPFAEEDLLALHRGHAHPDRLTDEERAAFEAAYETETGEMRRFQLKAAGAVILLYFLLLMVYALV